MEQHCLTVQTITPSNISREESRTVRPSHTYHSSLFQGAVSLIILTDITVHMWEYASMCMQFSVLGLESWQCKNLLVIFVTLSNKWLLRKCISV